MTFKASTVLALLLTTSSAPSLASDYLTLAEVGDKAEERHREARQAFNRLREHLARKIGSDELDAEHATVCMNYGRFLLQTASKRMDDAARVMIIHLTDGDKSPPPTPRQKFTAVMIYSEVKRDLETGIEQVNKCFATGRPFE